MLAGAFDRDFTNVAVGYFVTLHRPENAAS